MPLFEYRCSDCSIVFEAYKRPSDVEAEEKCPSCGAASEKVEISLVGAAGSGGSAAGKPAACGGGSGRFPFR